MEFDSELWVLVGGAVAAFIAGIAGYIRKPKSGVIDPVIAGVGLELGNRLQVDQLIAAQLETAKACREIAAAINDRKQHAMEDKIDDILERLDKPKR